MTDLQRQIIHDIQSGRIAGIIEFLDQIVNQKVFERVRKEDCWEIYPEHDVRGWGYIPKDEDLADSIVFSRLQEFTSLYYYLKDNGLITVILVKIKRKLSDGNESVEIPRDWRIGGTEFPKDQYDTSDMREKHKHGKLNVYYKVRGVLEDLVPYKISPTIKLDKFIESKYRTEVEQQLIIANRSSWTAFLIGLSSLIFTVCNSFFVSSPVAFPEELNVTTVRIVDTLLADSVNPVHNSVVRKQLHDSSVILQLESQAP